MFRDIQYISCKSDVKIALRSSDPDNYCLIVAQDSSAGALSTFGYYGSKGWCIDGKALTTEKEVIKNKHPDVPQYKIDTMLINTTQDYLIIIDGNGKEYRLAIAK